MLKLLSLSALTLSNTLLLILSAFLNALIITAVLYIFKPSLDKKILRAFVFSILSMGVIFVMTGAILIIEPSILGVLLIFLIGLIVQIILASKCLEFSFVAAILFLIIIDLFTWVISTGFEKLFSLFS